MFNGIQHKSKGKILAEFHKASPKCHLNRRLVGRPEDYGSTSWSAPPAHPDGFSLNLMLPDQMVESSLKNTCWSIADAIACFGVNNTSKIMYAKQFTSHAYAIDALSNHWEVIEWENIMFWLIYSDTALLPLNDQMYNLAFLAPTVQANIFQTLINVFF